MTAIEPVFPFRHIEEKTWLFLVAGSVAGGLAVPRAVTTLNGVELAGICGAASAMIGLGIYLALLRRFVPVHQIVGGKKRIAILTAEISFALAGFVIFAALQLNRTFASAPLIAVEVAVEKVNRLSGPKRFGWEVTFNIADKTYYQMVSPEVAELAMKSQTIVVNLQPGAFGYSYIVSASAR